MYRLLYSTLFPKWLIICLSSSLSSSVSAAVSPFILTIVLAIVGNGCVVTGGYVCGGWCWQLRWEGRVWW